MDDTRGYWAPGERLPVYDSLAPKLTCQPGVNAEETQRIKATACNWFVTASLRDVFGNADFIGADGKPLTANAIFAALPSNIGWTLLGDAGAQTVLAAAADQAAQGKAVVAVAQGSPNGHVALVLGGKLKASGGWKLNAPNSASYFINQPGNAYVGCMLSMAWQSPAGVKIYAHK